MITVKQFAAALGFAFVAMWIASGFGWALCCLGGALVFYAAASFFQGDLEREVGQIQARFGGGAGAGAESPYTTRPGATPPPPPPPAQPTSARVR